MMLWLKSCIICFRQISQCRPQMLLYKYNSPHTVLLPSKDVWFLQILEILIWYSTSTQSLTSLTSQGKYLEKGKSRKLFCTQTWWVSESHKQLIDTIYAKFATHPLAAHIYLSVALINTWNIASIEHSLQERHILQGLAEHGFWYCQSCFLFMFWASS